MNKRVSLGAALAIMLMVAAATFSITMIFAQNNINEKSADLEKSREMYIKFTDVDRNVRENYSGTIDEKLLMDSVAQGYIKGIGDRYAAYITAEEVKRLAQTKEGEDVGIGAVLTSSPEGYLLVNEVFPDSPAQVAGIESGDLIVKINDGNLSPENVSSYLSSIQGSAGTKLSLVVRKGSEDVVIPELTRRMVAVPSVYSRMLGDTGVAYILIKQFNDNTADQFSREMNKVMDAGASALIFDVRDNRGLSLTSASRILDKLVPGGVLYYATYRDGTSEPVQISDANEIDLPMVVITNAATSSAAELFAQDLKDFGKANTVGITTMGKGVIQKRIKLSDGSAIDLTVAILSPTSGVTFNLTGVKADYEVQPPEGDFTKLDETLDPQLKKALEVVSALKRAGETIKAESASGAASSEPEPEPPASSVPEPPSSSEPSSSEDEEIDGDASESSDEAEEASDAESSSEDSSEEEE